LPKAAHSQACIVIIIMSKLWRRPLPLPFDRLVPELKKVVLNVQFEEFAMKRLRHLIVSHPRLLVTCTAKLRKQQGSRYGNEGANIDAEQGSYPAEREAIEDNEETRIQEEEERSSRVPMDAQRELDKLLLLWTRREETGR
jgi:hypothetical protein